MLKKTKGKGAVTHWWSSKSSSCGAQLLHAGEVFPVRPVAQNIHGKDHADPAAALAPMNHWPENNRVCTAAPHKEGDLQLEQVLAKAIAALPNNLHSHPKSVPAPLVFMNRVDVVLCHADVGALKELLRGDEVVQLTAKIG